MKRYDKLAIAVVGAIFASTSLLLFIFISQVLLSDKLFDSAYGTEEEDLSQPAVDESIQPVNLTGNEGEKEWAQLRGIENLEYFNQIIFVKASVDEVASSLAPAFQHWKPDALAKPFEIGRRSAIVFRLKGHQWTEVLSWNVTNKLNAQQLSAQLNRPVLYYQVYDSDAPLEYAYFDSGQLIEQRVNGKDDMPNCDRPSAVSSNSKRKTCDVSILFQELDLFEPGISFEYFFDNEIPAPGDVVTLSNPGFTVSPDSNPPSKSTPFFERVDLLTD